MEEARPEGFWFITEAGNCDDCMVQQTLMKETRFLFFFLLMILAVPEIDAQESSDLPLMMIQTNDQTIGSGERIVAEMGLMDYSSSGRSNYLTDSFNVYNGRIFIKIRGSSSQQFPKKNYNFETQGNHDL